MDHCYSLVCSPGSPPSPCLPSPWDWTLIHVVSSWQDGQQFHSTLQDLLLCFFDHTYLRHLQNSANVWREKVIFQVQLSTLPFASELWPPSLLTLRQTHELDRVLLVSLTPAVSLCPNKIHVFSLLSITQVSVMSPEKKQQSYLSTSPWSAAPTLMGPQSLQLHQLPGASRICLCMVFKI